MAYKITGDLSSPARIIVLNESDMTIEANTTTSGSYEIGGLTSGSKVVLARTDTGESFGYASVSGIQSGATTLLSVYDCTEHASEFTDISNEGGDSFCETAADGDSQPASYVRVVSGGPAEGGNMISDVFTIGEKSTFEVYFDWETSGWYNDAMNNARNYFFIVKGDDYTVNTASWQYGNIDSPSYINVDLRAYSSNITYHDKILGKGSAVTSSVVGLADNWQPLTIEVDWENEHIKVWWHGALVIDEDLSTNTVANMDGSFQFGFHWHSYTKTAQMGYSRIRLLDGDKGDAVDIPCVRSMVSGEWTPQNSEIYVSGGVLNLDANSAAATEYVTTEWQYEVEDDFDVILPYSQSHNDGTRRIGFMIALSGESLSSPQNYFSIDRKWGTSRGFHGKYVIDGVETLHTRTLNEDFTYVSGWLRLTKIKDKYAVYFGPNVQWIWEMDNKLFEVEISAWADEKFVIRPYVYKEGTSAYIEGNFSQLRICRGNIS